MPKGFESTIASIASEERFTATPDDLTKELTRQAGGRPLEWDPNSDLEKPNQAEPPKKYMRENLDWNRLTQEASLRTSLHPDEVSRIKQRALERASDIRNVWAGKSPYALVTQIIVDSRKKTIEENDLGSSTEVTDEVKQQILEKVRAQMRGFTAERMARNINLMEAETPYIATDRENAEALIALGERSRVEDVKNLIGGTRKDLLVTTAAIENGLKKDPSFIQNIEQATNVDAACIEEMAHEVIKVHRNFDKLIKEHRQAHKGEDPTKIPTIYQDNILNAFREKNRDKTELTDQEKTAIEMVVQYGYREAGKAPDGNLPVHWLEKIYDQLEFKKTDKEGPGDIDAALDTYLGGYETVTLPDGVVMHEGKIAAVIEVKAYTKEEIDRWIELLQKGENNPDENLVIINGLQVILYGINSAEKKRRLTDAELEARKSSISSIAIDVNEETPALEVNEGVLKDKYRTYGSDIKNERNFAQIVGAESYNTPVILRLPAEATNEQLKALCDIATEKGLKNIVFQRMPVGVKDINKCAQKLASSIIPTTKENRWGNVLDRQILEEITKDETWQY